jgi:anti-sigma regulatory factor (Ser/Thr protein kinase)
MTAYGDESTAVKALEAGAASYVPKAQKAERLMSAVDRVAQYAVANRSPEGLAQCLFEYHCRFALKNDRRLIRALVGRVQQAMSGIGFTDIVEHVRIGEALEEALLNAMYHGNLEISNDELSQARAELDEHVLDDLVAERCKEARIAQRRIIVIVHLKESEARFVIRDEGCGFNAMLVAGKDTPDDFAFRHYRGMTLIRTLMDEVTFNKAGNELVMRKRGPVAIQK